MEAMRGLMLAGSWASSRSSRAPISSRAAAYGDERGSSLWSRRVSSSMRWRSSTASLKADSVYCNSERPLT